MLCSKYFVCQPESDDIKTLFFSPPLAHSRRLFVDASCLHNNSHDEGVDTKESSDIMFISYVIHLCKCHRVRQ